MRYDTHAYVHEWCMEWRRRRPTRFSKLRRMLEPNLRVPKVVSKETQVRTHLGVQEQPAVNWTLRSHKRPIATFLHGRKDNFKEPPMAPTPTQNSFESSGTNETSGRPESTKVLPHQIVGPYQAQLVGAPPLIAPNLGYPSSHKLNSRHLRYLGLF
jgi:hypothetical protein